MTEFVRKNPDLIRLVYYVAVSLDGYIAPPDGSLDWLAPYNAGGEDFGYGEFYKTVDALVEGSKTYEQALSFDAWPHPGKPCWVFTTRKLTSTRPEVHFTSVSPDELVRHLSRLGHERVWLVGGSQLAASFRQAGLITDYVLSVIPVFLGSGKPLFSGLCPVENVRLVESKPYPNGLIQVHYVQVKDFQQGVPGDLPTAARH